MTVTQSGEALVRARQAARSFKKLAPEASPIPCPPLAACLPANIAEHEGRLWAGEIMFCFILYVRPASLRKVRAAQLVPPTNHHCHGLGVGLNQWNLVMHPVENHMPSKAGEFDESAIIDHDEYSFILPALADLKSTRRDEGLLFHGPTWQSPFERAAIELELMKIGIKNVYQLRHGGTAKVRRYRK